MVMPKTSLFHSNDFDHYDLMPYQKFLHAPLMSGAPQKCFQSVPALANAGPECSSLVQLKVALT